ncbi:MULTISPECIES: transcription termination/antitermination protein NusG [unclassified Rhizobium]|uniref:transcription termination/antitermination protein NusG n=1 Tax=unclassified Rhizobium TaxID=2613769 RepID=UPI001ADC29C7|nr:MULTISPECIES: transcription termination/antitermination NusG family protein [unclassified Rhizobium]MBO9125473.1 transcription antiterminator [Rhizobium sp. 16-488-2b]MBO9176058.1 transcription antiterminator [Rhizobium sp. 16-488-2a]
MIMQHRTITMSDKVDMSRLWTKLDRAAQLRTIKANMLSIASANRNGEKFWFALRIMTGREENVEKVLLGAGVELIFPKTKAKEMKRRGRMITIPPRAALPGYMFVRCVFEPAAISGLKAIDDVIDLVGGGNPIRIGEKELMHFKGKAERGAYDTSTPVPDNFAEGVAVLVSDGPFKGWEGVVGKRNGKGRKGDEDEGNIPVDINQAGAVARIFLPLAMLVIL